MILKSDKGEVLVMRKISPGVEVTRRKFGHEEDQSWMELFYKIFA